MKKNVSKVLCRLLALIPACFAVQILFDLLLHTAYRYPAFDRACVSAADLVHIVIVICVLLAAAALICALLKGRLDHSMGTALLMVALLTPSAYLHPYCPRTFMKTPSIPIRRIFQIMDSGTQAYLILRGWKFCRHGKWSPMVRFPMFMTRIRRGKQGSAKSS